MSRPIASSSTIRQVQLPPPPPAITESSTIDPYEKLSFEPASQAQILRAHQRDTSQTQRFIELASEIIRYIAGTRWLAHKQTIVDLSVRALYLLLTFGRGSQTLGEEYTDILPYSHRLRRTPSTKRRLFTILLVLFPSILTTPTALSYLRASPDHDSAPTPFQKLRHRLATFLESPLGQALPEIHMIAFLFRGKFVELGRRLTGVSYISTLPSRGDGRSVPSYEPLALLMALPILYRLFPRRAIPPPTQATIPTSPNPKTLPKSSSHLPPTPPLTPPTIDSITISSPDEFDKPNTYLTASAQALPSRQCTLCLEPRGTGSGSGGTVGVTECGHVFCWGCLGGLDKLECPLCRQTLRMERLVAAYNL